MNQLVSSVKKDVFSTDGGFRLSDLGTPSAQETSFLPGRDLSPSPEINLHTEDPRQVLTDREGSDTETSVFRSTRTPGKNLRKSSCPQDLEK